MPQAFVEQQLQKEILFEGSAHDSHSGCGGRYLRPFQGGEIRGMPTLSSPPELSPSSHGHTAIGIVSMMLVVGAMVWVLVSRLRDERARQAAPVPVVVGADRVGPISRCRPVARLGGGRLGMRSGCRVPLSPAPLALVSSEPRSGRDMGGLLVAESDRPYCGVSCVGGVQGRHLATLRCCER
jgi:hypothetical protein